jgi:hypothetical protein
VHALQAHDEGFDLDASVRIAAQHAANRDALERILRYCARPPIAHDRLQLRPDGRVTLTIKTPWHDGTTHLDLDPLDFLARCAALIPRPHKNLLVYHGVLAAHASLRERVIAYGRAPASAPLAAVHATHANPTSPDDTTRFPDTSSRPTAPHRRSSWGDLMRHAFGFDLLTCPRCGAKMLLLANVLDRVTIRRILAHLRLPTDPEPAAPARASPTGELWPDHAA